MSLLDILLTLVLIALIGFIIINLTGRRRLSRSKDSASLYAMALNHMLHGEDDVAIRLFRDVIRADTDNIDAYINLGILMRKNGKPKNAIKIHESFFYW